MYALLALGFTMVYGIIELINFAHFNVFMVGSFIAMWVMQLLGFRGRARSLWPASDRRACASCFVVTMLAPACSASSIERMALRPLRGVPGTAPMITTIGVSYILFNVILLTVGADSKNYPNPMPNRALGIRRRGAASARGADLGRLARADDRAALFVRRTKMGKAMRATAQDAEAARMMGVDVDRVVVTAFFLGSALAGAAALIFGLYYNYTSFIIGYTAGLRAFTAAVLGGIGSIPGPCWAACSSASIESAGRPVSRGALDRRDHLLDPGAGAGVRADRAVRARRADQILTMAESTSRSDAAPQRSDGMAARGARCVAGCLGSRHRPRASSRSFSSLLGAAVPDRRPQ